MAGLASPQESGSWRVSRLWLWAAAFVLLILVILLSPLPPGVKRLSSAIGLITGGVSVAVACFVRSTRPAEPRRKRAWRLCGLATSVGLSGNIVLAITGPVAAAGTVSLSDLSLVLALLLGVAAVITFPATPRRPAEIARMVMDGVVLGGSLLFFASVTLFPQIVGPTGDLADRAVPLLVPVIDIVVATVAFLLYLRRTSIDGRFLGLVAVGFGLFAISDIASAIVTVSRPFDFGTVIDIFWIAGYLIIALAVSDWSSRPVAGVDHSEEGSAVVGTTIMFTVFLVGAAVSLRGDQSDALDAVSSVLWFSVLIAVVARQVTLIIDNERLRRGLERRVIERSRDLRKLSQRTDLLVNSVADGIYGVDRSGNVTFVNPVAARILGFDPEVLIGAHAHATFHATQVDGAPFPESGCYITEAIENGAVTTSEEDSYIRADGRSIPVEVTASPTTEDGESIGAVVVFRDITERLEVDRMKDEFVSIVSHELRTPLTSIRGALGLVEAGSLGELPPQAHRMVSIALDGSVRLGRLINDILDVERIHSGVMPMNTSEHAARDLIDFATTQVRVLSDKAQVSIEVGEVVGNVIADADRIEQTMINLLDNAIKFSPPGSVIRIHTRRIGAFIEFVVRDSGRGIPSGKLASIFRRFEQVDSSDARDKGGTGLGLAISRSIIERHDGRIWAENNPEGGATFRFTLLSSAVEHESDGHQLPSSEVGQRTNRQQQRPPAPASLDAVSLDQASTR